MSDGIEIAPDGSILITNVENGSVERMDASGKLETLARRKEIVWSDGINVTESGEVFLCLSLFFDTLAPAFIIGGFFRAA